MIRVAAPPRTPCRTDRNPPSSHPTTSPPVMRTPSRRCGRRPSRRPCAPAAARRRPARSRRRGRRRGFPRGRSRRPDAECRASPADRAGDADGEARAGERLAADEVFRQAEFAPERAHFVLEQLAQRLDQLHVHALGQAADVVVRLDRHRRAAGERHRFDHVGIERALGEELDRAAPVGGDLSCFALERLDEQPADRLALGLRLLDAVERAQKALSAATWTSGMLKWPRNSRTTSSPSPARIRPWSTKTQVSWSPIASWISTAATAESTPPERPQMTRPLPTWRGSPRAPRRGTPPSSSRSSSPRR